MYTYQVWVRPFGEGEPYILTTVQDKQQALRKARIALRNNKNAWVEEVETSDSQKKVEG